VNAGRIVDVIGRFASRSNAAQTVVELAFSLIICAMMYPLLLWLLSL
jgi:hypothetical protein